jgi:putative chitinase
MIDRKKFFDTVRENLFGGILTQSQVDGMNYLLDTWEERFAEDNPNDGINWLSYALATVFHETAYTMQPIEEYGKGSGQPYGQPAGPYGHCYYGRGHVMLTWEENYKNGEKYLKDRYNIIAHIHKYPHKMLQDETSAMILYDGMIYGWFTGVSLQTYFNAAKDIEDPYNARKIVNALDKAELIKGYYYEFKKALT